MSNIVKRGVKKLMVKTGPIRAKIKKNAPEILIGVGIVSMVGAVVTSAIAGTKLNDVLDEHEEELAKAKTVTEDDDRDEAEVKHDVTICYIHTAGKVAGLFALPVALAGVSAASFIKADNIRVARFEALSGAYMGLKELHEKYVQNNIELNGEENHQKCMYGYKKEVDPATGETKTVPKTAKDLASKDAEESLMREGFVVYNEHTSPGFKGIHCLDESTLLSCERILRSKAEAGEEPVLNDMFDILCMQRTDEGMIWGWDKDHLPELGIYDPCNVEFIEGRPYSRIILNPNPCVNVYQKRHRRRKVFDAQTDGIFENTRNAVC